MHAYLMFGRRLIHFVSINTWSSGIYSRIHGNFSASGGPPAALPGGAPVARAGGLCACGEQLRHKRVAARATNAGPPSIVDALVSLSLVHTYVRIMRNIYTRILYFIRPRSSKLLNRKKKRKNVPGMKIKTDGR